MGQLRDKRIVQSRNWLDPEQIVIPPYDFDYVYPITVYDAVMRTMDDNSPNLSDELESIYRLIADKQEIIPPGNPGQLMLWSGIKGQIGAMDIIKSINPDPSKRSHQKIPTERAVGDALDTKAPLSALNTHVNDNASHTSDIERTKWNSMAPLSSLQAHIANSVMHITDAERGRWNSKAAAEDVDAHIYNTTNPHNTDAHQVGAYTRREVDDMFASLRESFFNYVNISWDDRMNHAELIDYHSGNWNPNYILGNNDLLPDVPDPSLIYFALKPATDYLTNETNDCLIYVKRPGLSWNEVGFASMGSGDLVIKFPSTEMFVWIQGRFLRLFSDSTGAGAEELDGNVWRPRVDAAGILTWVLSNELTPPDPIKIKGEDGYTPIKGVDYDDGKDGKGVAVGGNAGDLLIKLSSENYDTTWKSLLDLLNDLVLAGSGLPSDVVIWDNIKGRPKWYNELGPNEDGFMTQNVITKQFEIVNNQISDILEQVEGPNGVAGIKNTIDDHLNDFANPHRVNPGIIGAVTITAFTDHTQNFGNPHNVKPIHLNLEKVDNTADMDKPISSATQEALNNLMDKLNIINNDVDGFNYLVNASWNNTAGKLVFTFRDGSKLDIVIPITDIFNSIYFDNLTKELVILLPDGSSHRINITSLIQVYYGSIGANIQVVIENDNIVKASIIPGTIGELEIAPSVHLRNSPTTTTQPVSDKSTRIATTEFVAARVINNLISYETERPVSANMARILDQKKADIEDVIQIINDLEGISVIDTLDSTNPLAALSANMGRHLDLTKAPRVHTSPSGSTYGRATISLFGHARASDVDPLMDGTVFRGTDDGLFARGDHRHGTDITRAPLHSPELTGEPKSTLPPDDSNDSRIATTWWVRQLINEGRYGTCSTAGNIETKVSNNSVELPGFIRAKGIMIVIKFSNEDSSLGITTLNVKNSGAANVQYQGVNVQANMIGKDHYAILIFDGIAWQLLNPCALVRPADDDNSNRVPTTEWVRRNAVGVNKGTSSTPGNVSLKIVTLKSDFMTNPPFLRQTGSTIVATFDHTDDSASATQLDVHGSGPAPVIYGGFPVTSNMISANHSHIFTFDGINWRLLNPAGIHILNDDDNSNRFISSEWARKNIAGTAWGTCNTASSTPIKVATLRSSYMSNPVFIRQIGSTVIIKFTAGDDSPGDTQLNVHSTGNYPVHFESRPIVPNMIGKDLDHIFVFDGTAWQLLNPSLMGTETYGGSDSGPANQMTEYLGFTIEGHGGTTTSDGEVNRALFTIPYKNIKPEGSKLTISNNAADWGARMGDNQLINLSSPVVLFNSRGHAVVQFTMATSYPSNSPCGLVARRPQASIKIESDRTPIAFVPVTSIDGVPNSINVGSSIKLSSITPSPVNATNQIITWNITNAGTTGAVINNGNLTVTGSGSLVLQAIVVKGASEISDYVQNFTISANAASIVITSQPVPYLEVLYGSISGTLSVTASIVSGTLSYQWYSNTLNNNTGGTAISGATSSTFTIPTNLTGGDHYFFCEVKATGGAATIRSNVTKITTIVKVTGVTISPRPTTLLAFDTIQFNANITPSNVTNNNVTWSTSDSSIANINSNGFVTANKAGSVTITVTTIDGGYTDSITINISSFISVTDIINVPTSVVVGQSLTLTSTILPSNAINQAIEWSIIDAKGTNATIISGNTLKVTNSIENEVIITIRATVANGVQPNISYRKDFLVTVKPDYIPVQDVTIESPQTRAQKELTLVGIVYPNDATNKTIIWSIEDDGGTGATLNGNKLIANTTGIVTMKATIVNGATKTTNYTKELDVFIEDAFVPVTDIIGITSTIFKDHPQKLTCSIQPSNATNQGITMRVVDPGTTNPTFDGDYITARSFGTIQLEATIYNGLSEEGVPFIKQFTINVIEFISVSDILNIPSSFRIGETLSLTGNVFPLTASFKNITWSIVNGGGTGSIISNENKLTATNTGTVRVRAKITNGLALSGSNTEYIQDVDIIVLPAFIPVTDITNLPTSCLIDTNLSLTGTIYPNNATNQTIIWSIEDDGGTGATLNGNIISSPVEGDVEIQIQVIHGTSNSVDFIKRFTIHFTEE